MKPRICINAYTLNYEHGGGHFWVYLNWALGMKAAGCDVVWLEWISGQLNEDQAAHKVALLKSRLASYGFGDILAVYAHHFDAYYEYAMKLEDVLDSDLLINFNHWTHPGVLNQFSKKAFIDIDPGLTQYWMAKKLIDVPIHDSYFTIGEHHA